MTLPGGHRGAVIFGLALVVAGSAVPTPLYAGFADRWDVAPGAMSLVFVGYPLGVLVSLLTFGAVSDVVGRRPVLMSCVVLSLIVCALFVAAQSVVWLVVARVLQGVATAGAVTAGGAALLDMSPLTARRAAIASTMAVEFGLAGGAVCASLMAVYAPKPLTTVFVAYATPLLVALVALVPLSETAPRDVERMTVPRRPSVPTAVRSRFAVVACVAASAWAVAGVYNALAPAIVLTFVGKQSTLVGGLSVAILSIAAGFVQPWQRRLSPVSTLGVGTGLLALGVALAASALWVASVPLFLCASAVVGLGFGLAFGGALNVLGEVTPRLARGGVVSAYYVVAYLAFGVPVVTVGYVAEAVGLQATVGWFGLVVVAAAIVAGGALALGHRRFRPVTEVPLPIRPL